MSTVPGGRNVFVMGDFALLDSEVETVEKPGKHSDVYFWSTVNFTISAVHNHMLGETPKITFLHFAAMGDLDQIIATLNSNRSNVNESRT